MRLSLTAWAVILSSTLAAQVSLAANQIITATDGDGSTCSITKKDGPTISVNINCRSVDGLITFPGILQAAGTVARIVNVDFGDIACLFGANPTSASVVFGAIGKVPPNSVGWQCSVSSRSGGNVIGATLVSGSLSWP